MTDFKPPHIGQTDQWIASIRDQQVPLFASVFRKFCSEEGVTRPEALELTVAFMKAFLATVAGRVK